MIIDFHTHIVPPEVKANRSHYNNVDRGFAAINGDPKSKLATAEELIGAMDKDEVDIAVALNYGWETHALCVQINDYILESIARYPERLVGFCTVNPAEGDIAVKEMERCIKAGAKGIGELRLDTQFPEGEFLEQLRPLAELMIEHKLMMLVHSSDPIGHAHPGKGTVTPDLLYNLAAAFPELKIICAHWGGGLPFYELMPEVKIVLKNVYYDTAASPFIFTNQIYGQVAQLCGADKILFGTDYPLLPPRRYIKEINALDLPQETKDKILFGNAKRLLGI
jgi:predicted TIM-barrel fold metal-dependent hydrolase